MGFEFEVVYQSGKENKVVDALSQKGMGKSWKPYLGHLGELWMDIWGGLEGEGIRLSKSYHKVLLLRISNIRFT